MSSPERRQHQRLEIRLPMECACLQGEPSGASAAYRTVTGNISSGGVYFEAEATGICEGMMLKLEMTVPPGDGHYPYAGQITGSGEVVRIEPLPDRTDVGGQAHKWVGVASRFKENLKLSF